MKPRVTLVSKDKSTVLEAGTAIAVSDASDVLIAIEGDREGQVRLDGRLRFSQQVGETRIISVDLSRSTGFHRLNIAPAFEYWFGTTDAKLALDGVTEMLRYLRSECQSWTGQLLFTDGSFLRDPHVMYGWLDMYADEALSAADQIVRDPLRGSRRMIAETGQGTSRISMSHTLQIIRRRPREMLEEGQGGPVKVGGKEFFPRRVAALRRSLTLDTPANRRVVWLLSQIGKLVTHVLAEVDETEERKRCETWSMRIDRLLTMSALAPLFPRAAARFEAGQPSIEEIVRPPYHQTYAIAGRLADLTGWAATRERRPVFSYVGMADTIYQAFVAAVFADALGLQPTAPAIGLKNPAFHGPRWDLYVNVAPPRNLLRSWRSYTSGPDRYRPDLLFHDKEAHRVVIGDAKYRVSNGGSPESGRKEVEAYMAAFGVDRVLMLYPQELGQPPAISHLEWDGRDMAEIAIGPAEGLLDWLRDVAVSELEKLQVEPPWHD